MSFFGGVATLVGLLVEPLGGVIGWGAYLWLTWTIRVVEETTRFPPCLSTPELSDLGLVLTYAVIGGLTALVLVIQQFPNEVLHVTFLDVDQGDAILIETPE